MSEKHYVNPDFIYNRADLWRSDAVFYEYREGHHVVAYSEGNTAYLGLWLTDITRDELNKVTEAIFASKKEIKKIEYSNAKIAYGRYNIKNHFRLLLPETSEELNERLTKKSLSTLKRKKRLIEDEYGEVKVIEYVVENVPEEIMRAYFSFKYITHHVDFRLSADEYIKKYHVSNFYVMYAGERIISIVLSCEQCPIVYFENITYDTELSKFSPGRLIYDEYLKKLIQKGKHEIYLLGVNDYKRKYDGIEETVYDGIIYRHKITQLVETLIYSIKKPIKKMLGRP